MRENPDATGVTADLRTRVALLIDELDAGGHDLAAAFAEQIAALLDADEPAASGRTSVHPSGVQIS